MTHNQYWAQRNKNLNDAILDEAYKDVANLEKQYDIAVKEIDDQIRAWYQRIANANGVSFAEAKKLLTSGELEGFKWTVEEYIARASEVSDKWANALENASARVHISRLESLKVQLQQHVEELTGKRLEVTQNAVEHAYTESYYHTAYELQKEVGLGVNMAQIDKKHLEKVLSRPWTADGSTFSDIIWKDNARLVDTINKELTRMIATGAAPDNAIKNISKAFNTSKSNAGRVVMTESAYFSSAAHKECFEDLDVEEYEIVGTFDKNMCSECGTLDGEHAPMSEYKEGITAPPFHPWCRCTTVPYFEDMKGIGERWMRNPETGKGDYVPSDMTYEEWKSIYVDKTSTMEEWQAKHGGVQKAVESQAQLLKKYGSVENMMLYGTDEDMVAWSDAAKVSGKTQKDILADISKSEIKTEKSDLKKPSAPVDDKRLSDKLKDAQSTSEISRITTEHFAQKGSGIESFDFDGCDLDAAKAIAVKADELDDIFKTTCKSVVVKNQNGFINGCSIPDPKSFIDWLKDDNLSDGILKTEMELNREYLRSKAVISNEFKSASRHAFRKVAQNPWIDEKNAQLSTFVHEFGHTILPGKANELAIERGKFNQKYMPFKRMYNEYIRELRDIDREITTVKSGFIGQPDALEKGIEATKELQKKYDSICISKYSKESVGEFIAEAFCDAELSSNPRPTSIKVRQKLLEYYGK